MRRGALLQRTSHSTSSRCLRFHPLDQLSHHRCTLEISELVTASLPNPDEPSPRHRREERILQSRRSGS